MLYPEPATCARCKGLYDANTDGWLLDGEPVCSPCWYANEHELAVTAVDVGDHDHEQLTEMQLHNVCRRCAHAWRNDDEPTTCPECGGPDLIVCWEKAEADDTAAACRQAGPDADLNRILQLLMMRHDRRGQP